MKERLRVAALADTHCSMTSQGSLLPLFNQVSESADVLLLGGDLTDCGLAEEAQILAKLRSEQRVALLHYSPIRAAVEGDKEE
jgi:hypothetical protein